MSLGGPSSIGGGGPSSLPGVGAPSPLPPSLSSPSIQPLTPISHFSLENHCHSVHFSPFPAPNGGFRLALATSQHYGIIGNGRLCIVEFHPTTGFGEICRFDTQDGLYDVSWSEQSERHVATSCGDGSVKLFDIEANTGRPLRDYREHQAEVYGVEWNPTAGDTFLSCSWDHTIKLWTPDRLQSLMTFSEHQYYVYGCCWAPTSPTQFISAGGDSTVKLWDRNMPNSALTIPAHSGEVLCCDWNKYDENVIASGSIDKTIKVWDIRSPERPLETLHGHGLAIRRLKFSPQFESIIASVSYDMTVCLWDLDKPDPLAMRGDAHTEFAVGLDFNVFDDTMLATCGWDHNLFLWKYR